jgi:hypothetical protein
MWTSWGEPSGEWGSVDANAPHRTAGPRVLHMFMRPPERGLG